MSELIVLENVVDQDGWRRLHVMANAPIDLAVPADAQVERTVEAGVHHLFVREPVQGVVDIYFEGLPMGFRRMVLWNLHGYSNAREAILDAAREFERLFGSQPVYGFMKRLPSGVENGQEIGALFLFEAEWVPRKCVAVWFTGDGGLNG